MTDTLIDVLQSEIFWKALAAAVAGIWSLPAVQWFRRELREHRMGILLDAARDVGSTIYRQTRRQMLKGEKDPDEVRRLARERLKKELQDRAPRLLGRVTEQQLARLIDDVLDAKEEKEMRKPDAISGASD